MLESKSGHGDKRGSWSRWDIRKEVDICHFIHEIVFHDEEYVFTFEKLTIAFLRMTQFYTI